MMKKFLRTLKTFRESTSGATAVEYALIVGVIAAGLLATLQAFRTDIIAAFNSVTFK